MGSDDADELVQDAIAVAAQMLDSLERRRKVVTPGNVCHHVALLMKSGQRSHGSGRTDAMAAATQLDGNSALRSLAEPASMDPETGDEMALGELLAQHEDDPAHLAARELDWETFLDSHVPFCRPPPLFSGLRGSPDLTATTRRPNMMPCPPSTPIGIREDSYRRRRWSPLESRSLSPARAPWPHDRRHPRLPYARTQGPR